MSLASSASASVTERGASRVAVVLRTVSWPRITQTSPVRSSLTAWVCQSLFPHFCPRRQSGSERHPGCDCIFRGKECRQAYVDAKTGNQTPGCPCADQARECVIGVCKGHQTDKGEELLSSGMGANASFGSNGHGGTWTENKRCRNMSVQNDKALVGRSLSSYCRVSPDEGV